MIKQGTQKAGVLAISKNDGNIKVPAPQKEKLI